MSTLFTKLNNAIEIVEPENGFNIRIKATLVSPLLQIDVTDSKNHTPTKKEYMFTDKMDYPIAVPVFSANGIRGILRRLAIKSITDIGQKADAFYKPAVKATTMNFYSSGSDTVTYLKSLSFNQREKAREIMPMLDLFGAGLSAIEGKLAVSSLKPTEEQILRQKITKKEDGTEEEETVRNYLIRTLNVARFDEASRSSFLTPLLDQESVEEWLDFREREAVIKNQKKDIAEKIKKKQQITDDEKKIMETVVENSTKMIASSDYVVPGTIMQGNIGIKRGFSDLTEIEKGLLFSILSELSLMQIGSKRNSGYGVIDWEISCDEYGSIVSLANPEYYLGKRKVFEIPDQIKSCIEEYQKWVVENRVWDYLEVDKLFEKIK